MHRRGGRGWDGWRGRRGVRGHRCGSSGAPALPGPGASHGSRWLPAVAGAPRRPARHLLTVLPFIPILPLRPEADESGRRKWPSGAVGMRVCVMMLRRGALLGALRAGRGRARRRLRRWVAGGGRGGPGPGWRPRGAAPRTWCTWPRGPASTSTASWPRCTRSGTPRPRSRCYSPPRVRATPPSWWPWPPPATPRRPRSSPATTWWSSPSGAMLEALDPLVSRDKIDLKRFFEKSVELARWTVGGKQQLFAIPLHPNPAVLFFNKDLFARRGVQGAGRHLDVGHPAGQRQEADRPRGAGGGGPLRADRPLDDRALDGRRHPRPGVEEVHPRPAGGRRPRSSGSPTWPCATGWP